MNTMTAKLFKLIIALGFLLSKTVFRLLRMTSLVCFRSSGIDESFLKVAFLAPRNFFGTFISLGSLGLHVRQVVLFHFYRRLH